MPRSTRRLGAAILAGSVVLGLSAATVEAGIQPALQINWSIDGGTMNNLLPIGTDANNDGVWNYFGQDSDDGGSGINLSWNLAADPDPELSGNIALFNNTLAPIDVFVQIILPVNVVLPSSLINGSAALGMTSDGSGGSIATVAGVDLWRAFIDGNEVASLFQDSYDLTNPGFGSVGDNEDFGSPVPLPGPALNNTIAIEMRFTLTPIDQASLTSVFVVVPGPGALLVLGLGMAFIRRRRRLA